MSQAYTYVMDGFPEEPEEGETLYHLTYGADNNGAAFVFDGIEWIEQTVTDHGQLSGVNSDSHHSRYTDTEAASAAPVDDVDGQTGSVTVSHPNSTQNAGGYPESGYKTIPAGQALYVVVTDVRLSNSDEYNESFSFNFADSSGVSGTCSGNNTQSYSGGPRLLESASRESNDLTLSVRYPQIEDHNHSI